VKLHASGRTQEIVRVILPHVEKGDGNLLKFAFFFISRDLERERVANGTWKAGWQLKTNLARLVS
jgi:hypothetical protein